MQAVLGVAAARSAANPADALSKVKQREANLSPVNSVRKGTKQSKKSRYELEVDFSSVSRQLGQESETDMDFDLDSSTHTGLHRESSQPRSRCGTDIGQANEDAGVIPLLPASIDESGQAPITPGSARSNKRLKTDPGNLLLSKPVPCRLESIPSRRALLKHVAAQKLGMGRIHEMSLQEVEAFFQALHCDEFGQLCWLDIAGILMNILECSPHIIDTLSDRVTRERWEVCDARNLFEALQQPFVADLLRKLQIDHRVQRHSRSGIDCKEIEWEEIKSHLAEESHRHDALSSLIVTTFYLFIFFMCIVYHLQIYARQQTERGLLNAVQINAATNTPEKFLEALSLSGGVVEGAGAVSFLSAGFATIFGRVKNDTSTYPSGAMRVQIASYNTLIGDIRFEWTGPNGNVKSNWLLHSTPGLSFLQMQPGQYLDVSKQVVAGWLDGPHSLPCGMKSDDVREVLLRFCTYNERKRIFTIVELELSLDKFGRRSLHYKAKAVLIEAYPSYYMWMIAVDVCYAAIILQLLWTESRDLWHRSLHGCSAVKAYFSEFYNLIDWINIILGLLNCGNWIYCCFAMQNDAIQSLFIKGTYRLKQDVMAPALSASEVKKVHDGLLELSYQFFFTHMCVTLNTISIVLKLFKGFSSNPRLHIVMETFYQARVKLVHFVVVFTACFTFFAVTAHILFGRDVMQFYTLGASFRTCFYTMMLDLSWYTKLSDDPSIQSGHFLDSGVPYRIMTLWVTCYLFFMAILMLNILLAIIIDTYSEELDKLHMNSCNAPTLFMQLVEFAVQEKERFSFNRKGFVPHHRISAAIDALPNDFGVTESVSTVGTSGSAPHQVLGNVIPGMQAEQVQHIISKMADRLAKEAAGETRNEKNSVANVMDLTQRIAEEIHVVSTDVKTFRSQLDDAAKRLATLAAMKKRGGRRISLQSPRRVLTEHGATAKRSLSSPTQITI